LPHLESHCRKEKDPDPDPQSSLGIQGSESISKCHGSGTQAPPFAYILRNLQDTHSSTYIHYAFSNGDTGKFYNTGRDRKSGLRKDIQKVTKTPGQNVLETG
jgi:hypothetical protein